MEQLPFKPDQSGYGFNRASAALSEQLDGPMGFYKSNKIKSSTNVDCKWILDYSEYLVFWPFFKNHSENVMAFNADLIIDSGDAQSYICKFVTNSLKIVKQGRCFEISLTLEARKQYA